MEAAFSWIQRIFDFIFDLIPRYVIVRATHEAVLWRRGFKVIRKRRNFWYWPLVSEYNTYPVARQTVHVDDVRISMADGNVLHMAGTVVIVIEDIVLAIGKKNWDIDDTIKDLVRSAMANAATKYTSPSPKKLAIEIDFEARQMLQLYGVRVEDFYFTKFIHTDIGYHVEGIQV